MAVRAHRKDRDRAAEIYRPVQDRLNRVEDRLRDLASVDFPFLAEMLSHVYGASRETCETRDNTVCGELSLA